MTAIGGHLTPGWYPDPEDADLERFWDGDAWTSKARQAPLLKMPPPARVAPSGSRGDREPVSAVVIAGYIFSVLFPLVGFILGLTQINRSSHGLRIVCGSVGMFLVYFMWLSR